MIRREQDDLLNHFGLLTAIASRPNCNERITDQNCLGMIHIHNSTIRGIDVERRFSRRDNLSNRMRIHTYNFIGSTPI